MSDKTTVLVTSDLGEKFIEAIKKVSPTVEVKQSTSDDEIHHLASEADVILAGKFNEEILNKATKLKWVHFMGAGVDKLMFPEFLTSPVICTNSSGIHVIQMSEYALELMLALAHRLHIFLKYQYNKEHPTREVGTKGYTELHGKTLSVIGLGRIGYQVARKAKVFDMKIIGVKKRPEIFSDPEGCVDQVFPSEGIPEALAQSDYVVTVLPHTKKTHQIIGEKEFKGMKKSAIFVHMGRGKVVDEEALIKALSEGRIAAAGLDVTEEEPLSLDSPLYDMENVILTLHTAGYSPLYNDRMTEVFCKNLGLFIKGEKMNNIVDKEEGY